MTEPIEVLVVDDHPLFREGVVHSLGLEAGIVVAGAAASGPAALRLAQELMPDVVLLDISMPEWSGLETARRLAAACPATAIVMLTVSEERDNLLAALQAGARGYVLKGVSARELARVVRAVAAGEAYVTPSLASEMLFTLTRTPAADPLQELTAREQEILGLIARGMTNREIGQSLALAEKTIKHYVTNILQKLQLRSRVEAALYHAGHLRAKA